MTREEADYSDWGQIEEQKENVIDVLDKIRTEIDGLTYYCETHPRTIIDDVLEIIDKYKESEVEQ